MGARPSFPQVPLSKDRIIVVTGANAGIGYQIAKHCAIMGATVIMACRSEERAKQAIAKIQQEFESEVVTGGEYRTTLALEFMQLDLGSFKSVVNFCEEFKKSGRQLHVLFCNAGIGFGDISKTADGFERMLQVNYLSHFLMIAKLLPVMKQSGPDCRILFTSSMAHAAGQKSAKTMQDDPNFGTWEYYGRSKAYQIMQTYAMARRFKDSNITFNCYHPGLVDSEFFSQTQGCVKCLCACVGCCGCSRTPIRGATCGIDLAVNPKHAGVTGHYWDDCSIKQPKPFTSNEENQEAIWRETLEYLKDYLSDDDVAAMEGK